MFQELIEGIEDLLEVARLARLQAGDKKAAATAAHGGVLGGGSGHADATQKVKASVKASDFAAKLQKGKNYKRHMRHAGDAETMRGKQAELATIRDRIQYGPNP